MKGEIKIRLSAHIGISLSLSLLIFSLTRLFTLSVVSFVSGVFIDLDHFWDYFRNEGLTFNFSDFFNKFYQKQYKKYYIPFHSLELILLLGLIIQFLPSNEIILGIFLGFSQHLFCDQISNSVESFGYFFLFRLGYNFDTKRIFKK